VDIMPRNLFATLAAVFACFALVPPHSLMADDCDAILKGGVFDIIKFDSQKSLASNYLDWLKTADFKEAKAASQFGLSIDLGPYGTYGGNTSEEQWNQSKSYREHLTEDTLSEKTAFRYFSAIANRDILDKWLECKRITLEKLGLSADFAVTPAEPEVLVTVHWRGTSQDPIVLKKLDELNVSSNTFAEYKVPSGADCVFRVTRRDLKKETVLVVSHNKALPSLYIRIPGEPEKVVVHENQKVSHERMDVAGALGSRPGGQAARAEIPKGTRLTSITVNSAPWVMGIAVSASDGSSQLFGLDRKHSEREQVINLPEGEEVIGLDVWYNFEIDAIAVVTNKRTYDMVGGDGNAFRTRHSRLQQYRVPAGWHVVGVFGTYSNVLNSISLVAEK
jgi:hypothetical protein